MKLLLARAVLIAVMGLVFLVPARAGDGTLYDALGGSDGVAKIVASTIDLSLKDARIAATFSESNIEHLKASIAEQICALTGGPCTYKGPDMAKAHKGLHLENSHFNALVENLQAAMDQQKIPFFTQNKLLALLAPMQRDVVTR